MATCECGCSRPLCAFVGCLAARKQERYELTVEKVAAWAVDCPRCVRGADDKCTYVPWTEKEIDEIKKDFVSSLPRMCQQCNCCTTRDPHCIW